VWRASRATVQSITEVLWRLCCLGDAKQMNREKCEFLPPTLEKEVSV